MQAAAIVILSILIAKIADLIVSRLLLRWVRKTENDFEDRIVDIVHRPLFLFVLSGGLAAAANLLSLEGWTRTVSYGILGTIAVIAGLGLAIRVNGLTLEVLSQNQDRFRYLGQRTLPLFRNVNNVLLLGVAAYIIFLGWRLDVSAWLAAAGILGIALGLGARDSVANFFAGVLFRADAP